MVFNYLVLSRFAIISYNVPVCNVQEHSDDILAASFDAPSLLATASYDGEIIVWNINSEQPSRRLSQRSRRRYQKSRGKFVSREVSKFESFVILQANFRITGFEETSKMSVIAKTFYIEKKIYSTYGIG